MTEQDVLAPLRFFYGLASGELPVAFLEAVVLPERERRLLSHDADMTSTLVRFHGAEIALDVHASARMGDYLVRASVLRRADTGAAVEFGAIGIDLAGFDGDARREVLAGRVPLGAILQRAELAFTSHPSGFFRIVIDERLGELLGCAPGQTLFGRCNELRHGDGRPLARVVEILPG